MKNKREQTTGIEPAEIILQVLKNQHVCRNVECFVEYFYRLI